MEILMNKQATKELRSTLDLQSSLISLLTLLFGDYQVLFTPQSLILTLHENKEISVIIDRINFDIL